MPSKVTKVVKIRHIDKGALKAFVDVEINDDMFVKDLAIRDGKYGEWVAFPSRKFTNKDGEEFYINIVAPAPSEDDDENSPGKKFQKHVNDVVLKAYHEGKKEGEADGDI